MKSLIDGILNRAPQYVPKNGGTSLVASTGSNSPLGAMGSVGTLFAIVDRIATSVAAVDWHLYRKRADGRRRYGPVEDSRVEVTSHLALDIWNKPNPFMTRQEFVEVISQHQDLVGESWWNITRGDLADLPLELWPLRPDRMSPVPHPTEYLSGYVYKNPDGQDIPLGLDEIIFIRRPNPLDAYRGMGPVQSLLANIDSLKYSAQWNRSFFLNDATPGGIIEVDKRLDDTEFDEMVTRWREQHQGVRNASRVAVIEQGKFQQVAFNMRDMQFAELREVNRQEIREAFGFHNGLLGGSEVGHSRAELEAVLVYFARYLLNPRLDRIKQALNNEFLPLFGGDNSLEFDYDDPTPEDRQVDMAEKQAHVDIALKLIDAGVDPAEAFEYCGLPPFELEKPEPPPQLVPQPDEEDQQQQVAARSNGHGKIGALR